MISNDGPPDLSDRQFRLIILLLSGGFLAVALSTDTWRELSQVFVPFLGAHILWWAFVLAGYFRDWLCFDR